MPGRCGRELGSLGGGEIKTTGSEAGRHEESQAQEVEMLGKRGAGGERTQQGMGCDWLWRAASLVPRVAWPTGSLHL